MELFIKRQKAMVKHRPRSHRLKWRVLALVVAVVLSLLPAMGLRTAQARSRFSFSILECDFTPRATFLSLSGEVFIVLARHCSGTSGRGIVRKSHC